MLWVIYNQRKQKSVPWTLNVGFFKTSEQANIFGSMKAKIFVQFVVQAH